MTPGVVGCSVTQCDPVCCSVLQGGSVVHCVCCTSLRCAAVCCSVLQHVTVWYSVVQCVAVCCSLVLSLEFVSQRQRYAFIGVT